MTSAKIKTATLGGTVWNDINHDGLQNDGNMGIAGVNVLLLNDKGKATGKFAITDVNGNYSFAGLKPGEYSVKFDVTTLPNGATITQKDVGHNNTIDSDANVSTGKTGTVELKAGDVNTSVDVGVVLPPEPAKATIGNFVWLDANANGIQDAGEAGIANQVVSLLDSQDQLVDSVITDNNGAYSFTVAPGDYKVNFFKPNQFYTFSPQQQGLDNKLDSNVDPNTFQALVTVKAGEVNNTIDAGLVNSAISIGASRGVWLDNNPGSGDRLGVKDADESGIAGVTVTLTGAGADNLFDTADDMRLSMATTNTGDYRFDNLPNDQNYRLQFSGIGANQQFTIPNALSTSTHGSSIPNDSDVDANGVAFVNNALPDHISAGVVTPDQLQPGTVSGHVWKDDNSNGIQDPGEAGYAGVNVILLDSPLGTLNTVTTTDSNGDYVFTGVTPADYLIQFAESNANYITPTLLHQGTDPNKDSDYDPSFAGTNNLVTVHTGETIKFDAGYLKAPLINIGATRGVWLDANGDSLKDGDATLEPGIEGVTVTLINRGADGVFGGVDDTVIATTTTNSNGDYNFPSVERAAYALVFSKPGSTINFTTMHNDNLTRGDIASDSDADGLGQVIVVDNTHPDFISAGVISIVGTPAATSIDTLIV